jgi:hypothetical protein
MLLSELVLEGMLNIRGTKFRNGSGFRFVLTEKALADESSLTEDERAAINYGVCQVKGKTSDQVSHDSHEQSQTWQDGCDGKELPIYADLLSAEKYAEVKARAERAASTLRKLG